MMEAELKGIMIIFPWSQLFQLPLNGQVLNAQQVWANAPPTAVATEPLVLSSTGGVYIYEVIIDNRWIPDELIIKYEEYARKKYGLQTGTRGFTQVP